MTIVQRKATTLAEVLIAVEEIVEEWYPGKDEQLEVWYRGVSSQKHELLPGMYRDGNASLKEREDAIFERFRLRSSPHIDSRVIDDWDWYFLAQHHGLPTRLLDWTESLTTAVYFALDSHRLDLGRNRYHQIVGGPRLTPDFDENSPTIWILEAGTLNSFAVQKDGVVLPGGPTSKDYLPERLAARTNNSQWPLAILAKHSNRRIAAQQGVFTVHGWNEGSLQGIATDPQSGVRLGQVLLPQGRVPHLCRDLLTLGIHKLSLFPELDSVAHYCYWFT